jgi:AcrR family transcriptional regulator
MARQKQNERSGETVASIRTKIIAGARSHFFAHGFRRVTMGDLAAELGMSKKTVYAHFPSKRALLEAVFGDKFESMSRDLDEIVLESSTDVSGALNRLLLCIRTHTDEIQPAFVRDVRRETPDVFAIVQKRRRELIQHYFGKLFIEGRKSGIIRKDIPTRLVIEILLGATDAVMTPPRVEELGITPKSGFSIILSVVLKGVLTEKGRETL